MSHRSAIQIFLAVLLLATLACNLGNARPTAQLTPTQGEDIPVPTLSLPPAETPSSAGAPAGFAPVVSLYEENFTFTPAHRITINELELARDALHLLIQTNWNGDKDTPLPIACTDFDAAKLAAYVADEDADTQALTIPADLEDLYTSPQAAADLGALILQAHGEYLSYLAAQGATPQLLGEIRQHTLPADLNRMQYHPVNDPQAPPSATEGRVIDADGHKDYSQLQMNLYPVDIYNGTLSLEKVGLLGEAPDDPAARLEYHRRLRDMSLRHLVYHEMTHVVQRAYVNLHAPADELTSKSAWMYASKTLTTVDTQYHWLWGNRIFADSNNRHVSDESQADGIAFEMFVNIYDLSAAQQQAVWDHFFGRLEGARAVLAELRTLFETHYPGFSADEFGEPLMDVMNTCSDFHQRSILGGVALRLAALPPYIGYMNPMLPQDTPKFWEALRQP